MDTRRTVKSNISLRQLIDVDEASGSLDRYDNIFHGQIMTAYVVKDRPKVFRFQYLSAVVQAGTGIGVTQNDNGSITIENLGVTKLIAGTNVTLSPTDGIGEVTINATGGGGSSTWGSITGTLSAQTDLQTALNAKFDDPTGTTSQYVRGDGSLAAFPSLSGYVPYTGATTDVDLGLYNLKADAVEFSQSPTDTAGVAKMVWNNTDGTLEFKLKGGNVTLQIGQEQLTRVVNKTGANLLESQYHVVYVWSAQGQRLAVKDAKADSEATSSGTLGVVTEDINTNQEGFITTSGLVRDINTTGSLQGETWADGDIIYLSATTAGGVTKVKPDAPNHIVTIGYVVYAHAIHGTIYVKVDNGYELDELHDVETSLSKTTPIDADSVLLQDSADSNIWKKLSWANLKATAKTYFDTLYQGTITLTTTGTSGAATLVGNTLNIPQYSGAAAPVKLLSQTLAVGSWSASGGYYVYTFSNVNIDSTCEISVTPQNASFLTAYTAQILPYIAVGSGSATFYSLFPPQGDIVVDIVITQTS